MTEALFLCGPRDARVAPFNLREGRSNEVLIEVAAVGICGSDLHYYKDGGSGSHSCRATSSAAPFATTFRARPCARRVWWRWTPTSRAPLRLAPQGYFNLCPNVQFFGAPPFDGAMTARLWAPTSQIVKLPPALTPLDAVMLEPLGVAMHAVDHPIGLLILQVLKAAGAPRSA